MTTTRSVPPESAPAEAERVVLWARVLFAAHEAPPSGRRSRPPRVDVTASLSGIIRSLEARLQAGGGAVEAQLSGQLIASFPSADALEAVELGLELLDEAEGYELAIALSLSMTWVDAGVRVGGAFDDSFFLAGRAKAGELLVDGALRDRVQGQFLYTRHVSSGGLRAGSVDRRHPRRGDSVRALALLGPPPLASATAELVDPVVEAMRAPDAFVILEGPIGAGAAELIDAVARELGSAPGLRIGAASGTLVPLESLRLSSADDPRTMELFGRAGLPALSELVAALDARLPPEGAWIVLNPLAAIDVVTMEVIAALRAARPARVSILSRAPVDAVIPPFLGAPTLRLTLPALRMADARAVVRALLGPATPDDVVRRVATMGGDTILGCEEAARLLVASGELVREAEAFVWRTAPRGGAEAVGVEELARARTELLSTDTRRALEIVSVAPPGASRGLLRAVALADGVGPRELEQSFGSLSAEGWLSPRDQPTAHFIRRAVQTSMPPARLAELNRFVLDALSADGPEWLARAHFAVEGDREIAAREEAVRIGEALRASGFDHAAVRFVGAPRSVPPREAAPSMPPEPGAPAPSVAPSRPSAPYAAVDVRTSQRAIDHDLARRESDDANGPDMRELRDALRTRDVGALESWVERATLAGADLPALARLRAVADLMRGDVANAEARLARSSEEAGPRALLAQAMVTLGAGRSADAVRFALRALSLALRRNDERGRSASLHALAACYRAEGRSSDADALAARAARSARA